MVDLFIPTKIINEVLIQTDPTISNFKENNPSEIYASNGIAMTINGKINLKYF